MYEIRIVSWLAAAALLSASWAAASAEGFASRCADRVAVERVHHAHRLGTRRSFEEVMPPGLVERLVRQDLRKEAVLRTVYGVEITPALLDGEVKRIDATTRAAEILAELKAALGHDPARFANAVARPIVVERTLRARFANDDALHAAERRRAEQARTAAITARALGPQGQASALGSLGDVHSITWRLGPRAADEDRAATPAAPAPPAQASASGGRYSVEATAQLAQVISSPADAAGHDREFHFDDLDPELRRVLAAQLAKPGDVSAVIETPSGFLVYVAEQRDARRLAASSISIPKRSYEQWLEAQPDPAP